MTKKKRFGRLKLSDFKIYFTSRYTDPWARIKRHKHIFGQLVFNKGVKVILRRKDRLFHKCCTTTVYSFARQTNLPFLIQHKKLNFKFMPHLNNRAKIFKLLE